MEFDDEFEDEFDDDLAEDEWAREEDEVPSSGHPTPTFQLPFGCTMSSLHVISPCTIVLSAMLRFWLEVLSS